MASLTILAVSLVIGVLLRRVKTVPPNAPVTLGALILYVPLPAICLLSLPELRWERSLISLALVTWIVFGLAYGLVTQLGRRWGWDRDFVGCLILTAGFCNSAFVGFPVIEALLGPAALKHAIFLDQSGSFLIVSSFGVYLALAYSTGTLRKRYLVKKIVFFPPFLAFVAGLGAGALGWRAEGVTRDVLERLAALLTPVALISVGLQLQWRNLREELSFLSLGLGYKLLVAPLVVFVIYHAAGVDRAIVKVSVLEAGMAPMITASILAASHNLRPRLAGMMVGVGVPLSFITLGFWYLLLNHVYP
jgi:predicted permease